MAFLIVTKILRENYAFFHIYLLFVHLLNFRSMASGKFLFLVTMCKILLVFHCWGFWLHSSKLFFGVTWKRKSEIELLQKLSDEKKRKKRKYWIPSIHSVRCWIFWEWNSRKRLWKNWELIFVTCTSKNCWNFSLDKVMDFPGMWKKWKIIYEKLIFYDSWVDQIVTGFLPPFHLVLTVPTSLWIRMN